MLRVDVQFHETVMKKYDMLRVDVQFYKTIMKLKSYWIPESEWCK